uniref:cell adhesion molecule-related/down-regulated by oncogenes-like n=1 Tax=Myxine glutinosa TaxID=7769 RepID=UPI00358FF67F
MDAILFAYCLLAVLAAAELSNDGSIGGFGGTSPQPNLARSQPTPEVARPIPPIIISSARGPDSTFYDLRWRPGVGAVSQVAVYLVRYRKITDVKPTPANVEPPSRWNSMRVPGDQRRLRLPGLFPDSCYDLRIEARGSAGHGQPATLVFCTTSGDADSSPKRAVRPHSQPPVSQDRPPAPTGVRAQVAGGSSGGVYVSWTPQGDLTPTAYTVEAQRNVWPSRRGRRKPGSRKLKGSEIALGTMGPVKRRTSSNAQGMRRSKNGGRNHRRRHGGRGEWRAVVLSVRGAQSAARVTGLAPGAVYRFRVAALGPHGRGPWSSPSHLFYVPSHDPPHPGPPSLASGPPTLPAPRITAAMAASSTAIRLAWQLPVETGSETIRSIAVYYRPTDSDDESAYSQLLLEGKREEYLLRGLLPETSYDLKLRWFSQDGASSHFSNVMICETRALGSEVKVRPSSVVARAGISSTGIRDTVSGHGLTRSTLVYLALGLGLGLLLLVTLLLLCLGFWKSRNMPDKHGSPSTHTSIPLPGTSCIQGSLVPATNAQCPGVSLAPQAPPICGKREVSNSETRRMLGDRYCWNCRNNNRCCGDVKGPSMNMNVDNLNAGRGRACFSIEQEGSTDATATA